MDALKASEKPVTKRKYTKLKKNESNGDPKRSLRSSAPIQPIISEIADETADLIHSPSPMTRDALTFSTPESENKELQEMNENTPQVILYL